MHLIYRAVGNQRKRESRGIAGKRGKSFHPTGGGGKRQRHGYDKPMSPRGCVGTIGGRFLLMKGDHIDIIKIMRPERKKKKSLPLPLS